MRAAGAAEDENRAEVYPVKITLRYTKPPIWRRVLVPSDLTLGRLHDVIQAAMGWLDAHLYEFQVAGKRYGDPEPGSGFGDSVHKASLVKLETLVDRGVDRFHYLYDFGDGWEHLITLEKPRPADPAVEYPIFVAGAGRCPPEDCGGIGGYYAFLEAMQDPAHEDHDAMLDWYGDPFDPEDIERHIIDIQIGRIAASRRGGTRGKGKTRAPRRSAS